MISLRGLLTAIAITGFMQIPYTSANADPSTGNLRNFRPSDDWLAKNKPLHITEEIQASECGQNTRLHYPHVQLFAYFKYNHDEDHYHGCPYGLCQAYTTVPQPEDMEMDMNNALSFFWHYTGGLSGPGVKPISNPQKGTFGYEDSLSGQYHDGSTPKNTIQYDHDANYPNFKEDKVPRWPPGASDRFSSGHKEPMHPKCGQACGPNKDPGIVPGEYGSSFWKPALAEEYPSPPGWNSDLCPKNSSVPVTDPCKQFCNCSAACKGDAECVDNCQKTNDSKSKCPKSKCESSTPRKDPDICQNYCGCKTTCKGNDECIKTKCAHIRKGCQTDKCSATDITPPPNSTVSTTKPSKVHRIESHSSGHHLDRNNNTSTSAERSSRRKIKSCLT